MLTCALIIQWTGTCIGKRNYQTYFLYVFTTLIGLLCVTFVCCYVLYGWLLIHKPTKEPLIRDTMPILMLVWCLILATFVGTLFIFHVYLIAQGLTTSECIRRVRPRSNVLGHIPVSTFTLTDAHRIEGTQAMVKPSDTYMASVCDATYNRHKLADNECPLLCMDCHMATPTKMLPMWRATTDEDITLAVEADILSHMRLLHILDDYEKNI